METRHTGVDLSPYTLELDKDRLVALACRLEQSLTDLDILLFAHLYEERDMLEQQTKYNAHYVRNLYSKRIYPFLSLLSGREVHGRVEACTVALQWGIMTVSPRQ